MLRIFKFLKDLLLFIPLTFIFLPFSRLFIFLTYFNKLLKWIYTSRKDFLYCDYFSPIRKYEKRFMLYDFVLGHFKLEDLQINYLEFGVGTGTSFKWWSEHNRNQNSQFYGFDTFEGLPEDWGGFYSKGDMSSDIPKLDDDRTLFIKGLFQDTLTKFLHENSKILSSNTTKLIHMDADLYSATAFTLSQLYPFLKKGDIILFDEFNVALHEFKAYLEFTENFYIKLKPIAAVNNFYQTAFMVE
ncbi:MAG: class I SAM-dependent methyltransferase [Ferruginibacter sp.]